MDLTFKVANKNDVQIIHQLADKIWRKHYPSIISIKQIEYMLQKMYSEAALLKQMEGGHEFTLALLNTIPVGYSSLNKTDTTNYFLHKFYVDVTYHRLGIGSKLFNYIVSKLPLASSIELTVNRKNYEAINFYFKNGFVIRAIADVDIGNDYFMNDFVMIRNG